MSTPEPLTINQAAAALGISERTLRKRIKAGEVRAEKEALEAGGVAWRVWLDGVESSEPISAPEGAPEVEPEPLRNYSARDGSEPEDDISAPEGTISEPETVAEPRSGTAPEVEIITLLKSENEHLRGQVDAWRLQAEAANRTAAETAAALREALKAMPKQLTEGTAGAPFGAPEKSTQESPPSSQTAPMEQTPAPAKIGAPGQSRARRLKPWQVVIMRMIGARE